MITLELVQEFALYREELKYGSKLTLEEHRVIGYKLYSYIQNGKDEYIHIMVKHSLAQFGETILLEDYYKWLILRRGSKLDSIGI